MHRGEHDQAERAAVAEHAAIFGGEGAADAGPRGPARRPRGGSAGAGFAGDGSAGAATPGRIDAAANAARMANGRTEFGGRHAARGLVEQDLDVPAQRQDRCPRPRAKPLIASTGKPTPAKPKAGEQMMPVRLRPKAQVPRRAAEAARRATDRPTISRHGGDARSAPGRRGTAPRRAPWMMTAHHDHHQQEDAEIGRELADQRRQRAAAGASPAIAHAAARRTPSRPRSPPAMAMTTCSTVGRIARSRNCGVVQRRIGQHILLDDQRPGREAAELAGRRSGRSAAAADTAAASALRGDVAGREDTACCRR